MTRQLRKLRRHSLAVLVAGSLAGVAFAQAPAAPKPGDESLAAIGRAAAEYFRALEQQTAPEDARAAVISAIAAAEAATKGWNALESSADLGRALELAAQAGAEKLRDGNVRVETLHEGAFTERGLEYALRLPDEYDASRRYPLLLSIPDHDEKPAEHLRTYWTHAAMRDAAILVAPSIPSERAEWTRVAVNGRPGGLTHALTVLRVASERFSVDAERVFVAGKGKGAPAAIACGNYSPHRFAGVVTRSGEPGDLAPENFSNLPVLLVSGGAQATAFHASAVKLGIEHCSLLPAGEEPAIWDWMTKRKRPSAPQSVTVVPGDPFPTRSYWVQLSPCAPDARATAQLDRAGNRVTITANGVARVTLHLNDELLDLDAPIRVVCNDNESTRTAARSLSHALELLRTQFSDTRCVYTARLDIDVIPRALARPAPSTPEADAQFFTQLDAAGTDATKLWELRLHCVTNQREHHAMLATAKLLRVDPDHAQARAALGHERAGERWFTSREARERYERGQDPAVAQSRGLVRRKSAWVHADEGALLGKGLSKDPVTGQWLDGAARAKLAKGWARQDLEWIEPGEVAQLDRGLWRVGGEWASLDTANQRRSSIESMWRIPTHEILLHTTVDRDVAMRAIEHMGRALEDLRRVFGAEPMLPLPVALMRDEEQYDRFAFGDPDGRRLATHAGRLHAVHYGFVAESWFPPSEGRRTFRGMGVGYWDAYVPHGDSYGVHSARLACGLSYAEALDPSPKAVKSAANGPAAGYYEAYQSEKRLPAWLRIGGAVYAERFFRDANVAEGGDPWWARAWSLDNLKRLGELDPLADVFAFELDPDDRDKSRKLMLEAGLLVAFLLDGGCEPVTAAHEDFKRALVAGRITPKSIAALCEALTANEAQLRAFAGR